MNSEVKFSDEWHRFYEKVVTRAPQDPDILNVIEEQLGNYESKWREFGPVQAEGFRRIATESDSGRLMVAVHNVELLSRVVLCRSIQLIRAFISSINRDDFVSAPLLLRATMEQAALGIHSAKKLRNGLEEFRSRKPDGERLFVEAQLSSLFGSKMNFGAIVKEVQERISQGRGIDYDTEELDLVKKLIEQRKFGESAILPEDSGFRAASVAQMVDDAADEPLQDGAPRRALRREWEYLSQYCHPSGFAWSFSLTEVFQGGGSFSPAGDLVRQKRMALARFVRAAWEWVMPLPGLAFNNLIEVRSEIEREAEALEPAP